MAKLGRKLTPSERRRADRNRDIEHLYKRGLEIKEIAEALGYGRSTICAALNTMKIKRRMK